MTEEDLTEEYLSKFPTILHNVLNDNPRYRKRFVKKVKLEFEDVRVFRAIHRADKITEDDFLCNIEEAKIYKHQVYRRESLEVYAISVNEDPYAIIKSLSMPNVERPALAIAEGMMQNEYGPSDYSKDKDHHNWYLYEDAIPIVKEKFRLRRIVETTDGTRLLEKDNNAYNNEKRGKQDEERNGFLG